LEYRSPEKVPSAKQQMAGDSPAFKLRSRRCVFKNPEVHEAVLEPSLKD
jgi:hypothetical protein